MQHQLNRRELLKAAGVAAAATAGAAAGLLAVPQWLQAAIDQPAARRPNIVMILADDLGFECLGANGSTSYRTPVLDKLADTGARFTQAYAQPLCTPSRVQLMTGLSNARNYINFGSMDPRSVTFANHLKAAGYATCMAGKWQLGHDLELPRKFGFDEYCLWQHTRRPPRYANPGLEINGVAKDYTSGEYGPDLVSDYALDFITRKKDGPFLLYYTMMLTHDPYQPTPDSKDWDPKARGEKVNQAPEHFGDMVAYMDKLTGKLVDKLDALGIRDNTLILFLGDNGTGKSTKSKMGDRVVTGGKGATTDAGMHVPMVVNWPGQIAGKQICADLVDTTDFLPAMLDAAGVKAPADARCDGRSFLPQLRGGKSQKREWIYSWYSPRQGNTARELVAREFAFNERFKLYKTGELYDRVADPHESRPIPVESRDAAATAAAKALQAAIEQFKDARPAEIDQRLRGTTRPGDQQPAPDPAPAD